MGSVDVPVARGGFIAGHVVGDPPAARGRNSDNTQILDTYGWVSDELKRSRG